MTGKWISAIPSRDKGAPLESRGSLNNIPLEEFKLYGAFKQVHTMQDDCNSFCYMKLASHVSCSDVGAFTLQKDKHGKLSE